MNHPYRYKLRLEGPEEERKITGTKIVHTKTL